MTEGAFRGRHALILEPTTGFRLLDLPPEIRANIFSLLLEENKPIRIEAFKLKGKDRRAVRESFESKHTRLHKNLQWDDSKGKWLDLPPSAYSLVRVSKHVSREVLPIAFGKNKFEFARTAELNIFLESIGSMRKYLRHIRLPDNRAYTAGRGAITFRNLLPAMDLRSIVINHTTICNTGGRDSRGVTLRDLIKDMEPYLRVLHASLTARDSHVIVLDVVRVVSKKCDGCLGNGYNCGQQNKDCRVVCDDPAIDAHCQQVQTKFRALLAAELSIQE